MGNSIRDTMLAGMVVGAFGVSACTTGAPSAEVQAAPTSVSASEAQMSGEDIGDPCPLDAEQRRRLEEVCTFFSHDGENDVDLLLPIEIESTPNTLRGCPCNQSVVVKFCDGTPEDCIPGDELHEPTRAFLGHDVLFGATVEGSSCKELCSSGTGGTVSVNQKCLSICRALQQ
jgi:hypothetical protein